MINFDSLTLRAFLEENESFINGAVVRKIQQPTRRDIILHLRNNGVNKKLYININPEFFHICFPDDKNYEKRGIKIPDTAPMFCMLLRKYIQNLRITDVFQPKGERILEFYFDYTDVLNDYSRLCLSIELMGKYSNIILYNKETGIIIGCAHNVGEDKSTVRELSGTLPYVYPVSRNKKDLNDENPQDFRRIFFSCENEDEIFKKLSSEYIDVTVPIAKKACQKSNFVADKVFQNLLSEINTENINPCCDENFDIFSLSETDNFKNFDSVNSMIDEFFTYNQLQKILKQKKTKIYTFLQTKLNKLEKQKEQFAEKALLLPKAELYKQKGDILMMNPKIPVGKKVILANPYDNGTIEIELDEKLSVIENANRYYKLYKKIKSAMEYASSQNENTNAEIELAKLQIFYTDIANSVSDIDDIMTELEISSIDNRKKNKNSEKILQKFEIEGFKIFIGKNSLQNDYLLSKIAVGEDLWFHPQNCHGAHLILKKNNPYETVSDRVLLECAKLTKKYSQKSNEAKMPVIYTKRKYVKKAGSKIAFVTYKNEKEIYC